MNFPNPFMSPSSTPFCFRCKYAQEIDRLSGKFKCTMFDNIVTICWSPTQFAMQCVALDESTYPVGNFNLDTRPELPRVVIGLSRDKQ